MNMLHLDHRQMNSLFKLFFVVDNLCLKFVRNFLEVTSLIMVVKLIKLSNETRTIIKAKTEK